MRLGNNLLSALTRPRLTRANQRYQPQDETINRQSPFKPRHLGHQDFQQFSKCRPLV